MWSAETAARCPFYPQRPEDFDEYRRKQSEALKARIAAGLMRRVGVSDGQGGSPGRLRKIRAKSQLHAEKIVAHMADQNLLPADDAMALRALTYAISVVDAKVDSTKDRLTAARVVLDYTKQKPATKADLTIRKAEDFLADLAKDAG